MNTLIEILGMRRPHKGVNERAVAEVILPRLGLPIEELTDANGMVMGYMICPDVGGKTLFTAHLDTVHFTDGPNPILFDEELEWMWKEDGSALGADDGAGIWVLYNMIKAGIPGSYLFTVGEERGGVGAKGVATYHSMWLKSFDRAITFDRKGTTSVISHQAMCGRCCSDEFATALSSALTKGMESTEYLAGAVYRPDSTGVYTDTAEFVDLIPECTNVSAGYANEHTGQETLDVGYLKALLEICLTLQWDLLPTKRDPSVKDYDDWGDYGTGWSRFSRTKAVAKKSRKKNKKLRVVPIADVRHMSDYTDLSGGTEVIHDFSGTNDEDYNDDYLNDPVDSWDERDWDDPGFALRRMGDQEILDLAAADPNWAGEMLICAKYGELDELN